MEESFISMQVEDIGMAYSVNHQIGCSDCLLSARSMTGKVTGE